MKDYYDKYYTPSLAKVTIVGDLSEQEAKQKLDLLSKWASKNVTMPALLLRSRSKLNNFFYDINGAPSSVVNMGYIAHQVRSLTEISSRTKLPILLSEATSSSRINLNLREQKGYTYGIHSAFMGDSYKGYFLINSSVKRKSTALSLAEISKELKEYETNGITDKELEFTKISS